MTSRVVLPPAVRPVAASFPSASCRIGGVGVVPATAAEACRILLDRIEARFFTRVAFLNAHCANVAYREPAYRDCLDAFVVLPDGIGVDIASRILDGRRFPENLNGTDFVPRLLRAGSRPLTVALVGAAPGVVDRAALAFAAAHPLHAFHAVSHGFFAEGPETEAVTARLRGIRPDVVLVALGVPRQELFIARHLSDREGTVAIGVGALFDFIAGEVSRAPRALRALRMEWVYRLALEPKRLWKRYLLGNPVFIAHVLADRLRANRRAA